MTYREWITATCSRLNISSSDIDLILTNQAELIPDETKKVDVKTAKLALCREFSSILPMANISEGGLSITWNMEAVKAWYNSMCRELGIASVFNPKVKGRNDLW